MFSLLNLDTGFTDFFNNCSLSQVLNNFGGPFIVGYFFVPESPVLKISFIFVEYSIDPLLNAVASRIACEGI